ncbi:alpha/beta hydrolase [Roseomonas sp. HJA6]|uniref:Alpha/beta hydrolase n=1 Tax=Roseomonas alba TaxID=2846776 RepID=A0ABS7A7H2_9PROT|nr:alpha/beta hydrolase [Neoroseomonas alba]
MSGRRIELSARDGLRLAATEWPGAADRTPLLCLSGICRTALDYAAIGARHGGTRRVVALDYAGHGESARAADPRRYAPEKLIADVIDAMAALGLHRVAVVGTSFGGLVAFALGVMRPASLAAVVLNDIGPEIERDGREAVVELVGTDPCCATLEDATAWLRRRHPPMELLDEEGWRALAWRTYAEGEDRLWHPRWDIRVGQQAVGPDAGPPPDLWPYFGALAKLPLMLVWGQQSHLLSVDTVALMRKARPDMRLVTLPGTGHAPTLEEPAAVAGLDRFLAALP